METSTDTEVPQVREYYGEWRVYFGGSYVGFGEQDDAEEYAAEISPNGRYELV